MELAVVVVAASLAALVGVGLCAVLCVRLWALCFPNDEPEARTVLSNPTSWMIASYPTQVVAAYPDPWDERSPDVVVYRTWT
ncbi:uncharacterized protein LOC126377412 isoform X2 [Pectinophora gossypiella]|uniref:uncharacterized protein LOC126377412 isoform X2 n=1 Tax=Pectinophora gossypiella TaxID=13191 RepID=UPI00214F527F|nr:uncharacterized protein LOC126377412 isoform X2 [Pectinophora gossypiella]